MSRIVGDAGALGWQLASPPGRYLGGLFKVWDGASPNFRR